MAENNVIPPVLPVTEPELRRTKIDPKGVLQKNLKTFVYLGAALLVIAAALFSSTAKKTPQASAKGQPPQPTLQDNTDNNVQDLKNQLKAERDKEAQQQAGDTTNSNDPALASATPAQRAAAAAYGPTGVSVPCIPNQANPAQPCQQPGYGPAGYGQQPAPDDAAMPLGMAVVLAGFLVLVAGLGGKRENGEAGVVGGAGDGVIAEEADKRNAILIHGESPLFEFPDWPGHPLAKPEREARLPSAKPRILEQGPKLDLGEESGKQSGDVPPGAGYGPKRVTGQSRDRNERRALHDLHRPRYSRPAKPALLSVEPSNCRLLKRPERQTDIPSLRDCWRDSPPAKKRRAYLPRFVTAKGHGKRLVWDVSSVRVTRRPGRPGSG